MKKSIIKTLSALTLLVLVLSVLPTVAFADASETFFLTPCGGYSCTGSGSITLTQAKAIFDATAIPLEPILPDEMCPSKVWVLVFDTTGELMGATTSNGTTHTSATYIPSGTVDHTYCSFEFMGTDLGGYILMNSQS